MIPLYLIWTGAGALYVSVGVLISCLFKAREAVQEQLHEHGCGLECCPGIKCGDYKADSAGYRSHHRCNGNYGTVSHRDSGDLCGVAKYFAIPAWPVVLTFSVLIKLYGLVRDLWYQTEKYALKNRQIRGKIDG